MELDLKELTAFCSDLVLKGGQKALTFYQTSLHIKTKIDKSLVSKADRQIEIALTQAIKAKYPHHAIYGEETGGTLTTTKPLWIIDPIEGTTNFVHGIPVFGTQIALLYQGEIVVAAVYDPVSRTSASASKNGGAFLNGQPVSLLSQPLEQTTLLFDTGRNRELAHQFLKERIIPQFRSFRRLGSLVTDIFFLLNHKASVYFGFTAKLYDFAPASLILKEAGYDIVDLSLRQWTPSETVSLLAFHPSLRSEIIPLLSRLKPYY
jgi:myo-inositol-1(or 4)-monophosphatase